MSRWGVFQRLCLFLMLVISLLVVGTGCEPDGQGGSPPVGDGQGDTRSAFVLQSEAFVADGPIPVKYTGDGENVSPPLKWSKAPEGTRQLVLIVDDPDAPRPEPWVHWVMYKIAADVSELPEAVAAAAELTEPAGALQGVNSSGSMGYRGPAPPRGHGVHHYHFRLYALDTPLEAEAGWDKAALLAAIEGHVLGRAELVGTYQR